LGRFIRPLPWVLEENNFDPMIGLSSGICICLLSTLFITFKTLGQKDASYVYNAFFILNEGENKILSIEGYDFVCAEICIHRIRTRGGLLN
jgi:hypothetical protein